MRMVKIIGIIILIPIAVAAIFLIVSTINHLNQLEKEAVGYVPPGKMVEVNDRKFHVYIEGKGPLTLVFMSGHGTIYPTLDFKPLWMRMADDYRIAVIEKSGYGWSETSNSPRDIDTMLEETRKALKLSGEKGPYVLFPHSMSGLEAIYWAQKYPEEVKAIIGLDPLTPEAYKILPEPNKIQLFAMYFISRSGITRYMPDSDIEINFPLMKSEVLTEEEKQEYLAVFYKSAFSKDMLREVNFINANAETVAENGVPINTPMYYFISDGQEAVANGWTEGLTDYLSKLTLGKHMHLAADHYVHYEKSDVIAKEANVFLDEVK